MGLLSDSSARPVPTTERRRRGRTCEAHWSGARGRRWARRADTQLVLAHFHHHKHGKGARKHELGKHAGARLLTKTCSRSALPFVISCRSPFITLPSVTHLPRTPKHLHQTCCPLLRYGCAL